MGSQNSKCEKSSPFCPLLGDWDNIVRIKRGWIGIRMSDVYFFDDYGRKHNDDGPAVVRSNGHKEWYRHGVYFREGGLPIEEKDNGDLTWYKDGEPIDRYNVFLAEIWDGPRDGGTGTPCIYITAEEEMNAIESKGLVFPNATKMRLMVLVEKERKQAMICDDKEEIIKRTRPQYENVDSS